MIVAVISNPSTPSGKSSFITALATTFAHTQNKVASIFSTEEMSDYLETVTVQARPIGAQSMNVYNALMTNGQLQGEEYYDYANRIGDERVYAFNIFGAHLDQRILEKLFITTLSRCDSELVLVEIAGDYTSPFNQEVINLCHSFIYVANTDNKSFKQIDAYKKTMTFDAFERTGFIFQKYDDKVISEKQVSKRIGIPIRNMLIMNYNPVVQKLALEGEQDRLGQLIASGHGETIKLRMRMLETMQYLFDSPNHKYIKDPSTWRQ